MRRPYRLTHVLFLLLLICAFTLPAQARIKCWKNKDGVRECGNTVPPEYSQQSHEELNKQGIVTEKAQRAKTEEELRAEREAARRIAEQQRKARQQALKDKVLLDTFSTEDDLLMTRDGKITNVESDIKLAESQIERLKKNLNDMIHQAATEERKGNKPSEKTTRNIASVRAQIASKRGFIAKKRAEQESIRRQFERDLKRFRTLKGRAPE